MYVQGKTALHLAAMYGRSEVIRVLLESYGNTALLRLNYSNT